MGINKNNLRFLLLARKTGVDFSKVAMIGRQTINMPIEHFVGVMENESGFKESRETWKNIFGDRYAERLLQYLGALVTDSFDFSEYENATYIHDFNTPISDSFKKKYSLVIDGGSLEHIFNFPVAIKNCMDMVGENGHFISITPSNNNFGHGFYQFSPELFYRVLSKDNGFNINSMYYYDSKFSPKWKSVEDPERVGKRVTLINNKPLFLVVLAQRERITSLLEKTPQQSDYQTLWQDHNKNSNGKSASTSIIKRIKSIFPITFRIWLFRKLNSKPNAEFFKTLNIISLLKK